MFLSWLVMADPNYRNGWVWFPDISKHLFKRFKAEAAVDISSLARWFAAWARWRPGRLICHEEQRPTPQAATAAL